MFLHRNFRRYPCPAFIFMKFGQIYRANRGLVRHRAPAHLCHLAAFARNVNQLIYGRAELRPGSNLLTRLYPNGTSSNSRNTHGPGSASTVSLCPSWRDQLCQAFQYGRSSLRRSTRRRHRQTASPVACLRPAFTYGPAH